MDQCFLVNVLAKPNSKKESVSWDEESNYFVIRVSTLPIRGKANKKITKLLKDFLNAKEVKLVKGSRSQIKTFEIKGSEKPSFIKNLKK